MADPNYSAGARYERRANLARVRRQKKKARDPLVIDALDLMESYLVTRQKRYDRRKGGLGK